MLSSERRGSSARRGMTVLGKIPAVPKPINLPSQRLENRGLDPNVEIVPRGSVSWGSTGRSPPTSSNAWGTPAQASSPPSSSGAWGSRAGAGSTGSGGVSGGSTLVGPGNIPRPSSGGSGARPTSGGPGARPLSAESVGPTPDSFSTNSSAWGARPSSASGVLGQAQPQPALAQSRPRSADIARPTRSLSEFEEPAGNPSPAGSAAWGNRGPPRRLGEEPHQVSRFQLTRTDFPTLGSEKNPDLRPQHSTSGGDRGSSLESKAQQLEERGPPPPPVPHEDGPATGSGVGYGHPERGAPDSWRREAPAFQGPSPAGTEGSWHRDGPPARPSYGGPVPAQAESWRREGGPSDDNWRRGGAPPVGQYGPPPGPGHYAHEGPGFMHPARFGPGPAFVRGSPGPGGYGPHGDMYGNAGPLLRPGGPMHPMRPNMFQGPVPYDGFYGPPPGAGYQGMEDPERMMMGMGGGPYGGFPQHRGPPPEAFGRFPHGGMNQGPRHPQGSNNLRDRGRERERVDAAGGDGYHDGPSFRSERHGGGEGVDSRRAALHQGGAGVGPELHGPGEGQGPRGVSGVHHGGHRDWAAAASSDEPMDFSKPVFEEEVASASPSGSGKLSPGFATASAPAAGPSAMEERLVEVKRKDMRLEANAENIVVEVESVKEEEKKEVVAAKSETVAAGRSLEVASSSEKSRADGVEVSDARGPGGERKSPTVVDKEVVARIVTKEGPGKWERNSKREVIGPSAGGAASASIRSGPSAMVGPAKSSIQGNAPRNAGGELHPVESEKSVAATGPPISESEVPSGVEKGRNSRRSESPRAVSGSLDSGVCEGSGPPTATVADSGAKDGSKAKGKASSHDGEKEWRPKMPIAEANLRGVAVGVAKVGASSSTSGTEPTTEESATESESGPKPGSYDYDAQRAKMREIAAQRASQLQKEEEERIKEQKAKARAKLEELDRRATVVVVGGGEEADAEGWKTSGEADAEGWKTSGEADEGDRAEESPAVVAEVVVPSASGSTKRGARNEHNKRDRDRKSNGRKAGVGEAAKGKVGGSVAAGGSAILPPPVGSASASGGPLLTTPAAGPDGYGHQASFSREPRHRGRPEKKQVVAKSEEVVRSVAVNSFSDVGSSGAMGGWSMDKPLPHPMDSASPLHLDTIGAEGSGLVRKSKNSRNGRSRPRPEAVAVMAESIQFGDIVSGVHIPAFQSMVGSEQAGYPGSGSSHAEGGKDGSVSASGDALTGDEGSANGDAAGKRLQRKSRGARRGPGRGDRGSQEQRAADKSHGGDSMVWAPVRSPGAGGGTKGDVVAASEQQPKEESTSAQQQARGAKRAEMERYTPKPLMKYQESSSDQAGGVVQHAQSAQGVSSSPGGLSSPASVSESPHASTPSASKLPGSADPKTSQDVKGLESGTKGGKSHGSWRQRGAGSERVSEGSKEVPAAALNASRSSGLGDSGHPRPRAEQRGDGGPVPPRRHQALSENVVVAPQAPPPVVSAVPAPVSESASAGPGPVPASEREPPGDKTLYQPPRPGFAGGPRGQDHRVQDYRGQEGRGQEQRGQDFRGQDQRGQDYRGQGGHGSESKRHEPGVGPHSRHSYAPSDRASFGENVGSQQHHPHQQQHLQQQNHHQHQQHQQVHRNGVGQHHPRSLNAEKEQAPSHQAFPGPQSQQRFQATTGSKEPSPAGSLSRDGPQQPASRVSVQHALEAGEQGSNHRGGRSERDQSARPSSGPQRGQGHWQQAGGGEGFRSGASRAPPHPTERESAVGPPLGRAEASKQQASDSQRGMVSEPGGPPPSKAHQQSAPAALPSPKRDGGNWEGSGDGGAVARVREYSHGRRGRFGGRSGPRNVEMDSRREAPSNKQRLVINATGELTNRRQELAGSTWR